MITERESRERGKKGKKKLFDFISLLTLGHRQEIYISDEYSRSLEGNVWTHITKVNSVRSRNSSINIEIRREAGKKTKEKENCSLFIFILFFFS